MDCPHWGSGETSRRRRRTALGYPRFNCRACGRRFHERTGTPFNDLQDPTDIVRLAVLGRLRYTLRFRAVVALLLQRGDAVTHETIRNWECCCAPLWADPLRAKRRGRAGVAWSIDETSVKGAGRWCYLDRASDREGALLDSRRRAQRDTHAARRFLRRLVDVAERKPERVTTDPHPPYRRAIRWILGRTVRPRCNRYLNTLTEPSSGPSSRAMTRCWAAGVSRLPPGAVPRSLRGASTAALANEEPNGCRWLNSDDSLSSAGGH